MWNNHWVIVVKMYKQEIIESCEVCTQTKALGLSTGNNDTIKSNVHDDFGPVRTHFYSVKQSTLRFTFRQDDGLVAVHSFHFMNHQVYS